MTMCSCMGQRWAFWGHVTDTMKTQISQMNTMKRHFNEDRSNEIPHLAAQHVHFPFKINMKNRGAHLMQGFLDMPSSTSTIDSQLVHEDRYLTCTVTCVHHAISGNFTLVVVPSHAFIYTAYL